MLSLASMQDETADLSRPLLSLHCTCSLHELGMQWASGPYLKQSVPMQIWGSWPCCRALRSYTAPACQMRMMSGFCAQAWMACTGETKQTSC